MKKREHEIVETFRSLSEQNKQRIIKEAAKRQSEIDKLEKFHENYYIKQAMRDRNQRNRSQLMEGARNDAFASIVKAIYITAMEAESLTDENLILAESMVDTWIKENGGASKILSKVGNDSYLLSRITQIVEDAAEEEVKEIESDEDADDVKEEPKDEKDEALSTASEFIKNASKDELKKFMDDIKSAAQDRKDIINGEKDVEKANKEVEKAEEKLDKAKAKSEGDEEDGVIDDELDKTSDSDNNDDSVSVDDKEDDSSSDSSDDDLDLDDIDSDDLEIKEDDDKEENKEEDKDEDPLSDDLEVDDDIEGLDSDDDDLDFDLDDDDEKDPDIDDSVVDDIEEPDDDDEDITIDGDADSDDVEDSDDDSHGKVFDELEKEDDVKKAIDLIRTRVADAEQKFIKNNAEDKKKIDDLLSKISQNVKTVEDMEDRGDKNEAEIASESVRMDKRRIDAIRNNRPLTIFECMTRKYSENVIKDETAKKAYLNESGSIDTDLVIESAKVMYGFLETLNTLQLEKVDAQYIKKVLDNM